MSYYIIGYTLQEYLVKGTLIPKKVYTAEEKAKGKKEYSEVSKEDLDILRTINVFKTLEASKKIRVLDKLPSWAVSGVDREAALQAKIKNMVSKEELEAATSAVTSEAQKIIDDLRAQLAAAKSKE